MIKTIIFCIFLSLGLFSQEIIEVSVQGISDGVRNDKLRDRNEAEIDAMLKAIEKAGLSIEFMTKVENFFLKHDMIESKAEAVLLPGFQIVDIGYDADGLYHIVLTGKVHASSPGSSGVADFKTVTIGTQLWMSENLNVDKYRNGDPIPEVQDPEKWRDITYGAWCYYNNNPEYGRIYGKLYNWYAVNDPRGLGPEGWHVPSDLEWSILTDHLGGESSAGAQLRRRSVWQDSDKGTNSSGFSALRGGFRHYDGVFRFLGMDTYFWSSTEHGDRALNRNLNFYGSRIYHALYIKQSGFSVRLLRD